MPRSHKEGALLRWSRRKLASTGVATEPEESAEQTTVNQESVTGDPREVDESRRGDEALVELPPIDELGPDSDFQGFMDPQVDDSLRRAALKKLFRDPHFNVTDGLDVYAEDYTKLESMTPAMVAGLKHAQRLLFGAVDGDKQTETARPENTLDPAGMLLFPKREHFLDRLALQIRLRTTQIARYYRELPALGVADDVFFTAIGQWPDDNVLAIIG